jgi:hypothetical protein
MRASRMAFCLIASLTWACANGGDPSVDDGEPGLGDSGSGVGHDSGSGGSSGSGSGGGSGSSSGSRDSGSGGNEAAMASDASGDDATDPQESSTMQEASSSETGTGQETGVVNGVCPSGGKYAIEAAAAVISGSPTICLVPNCPSGDCCYEQVSPFNVCVAQ